jgi:hypothetical protein
MNRSRDLRELALRISKDVVDEPFIEAALITGSVARGIADAHSDIDVIFYLSEPVPDPFFDAQKSAAVASGGGFYGGSATEGFGVFHFFDGVKVDFGFNLASEIDGFVSDVVDKGDTELVKQQIIAGVRDGEAFHGHERIAGWVARTDVFPAELRGAMLKANLGFTPIWVVQTMGVDRSDRLFVSELLVENAKRMLSVLYALNGIYHPNKFKGADIDTLTIAPTAFGPKLDALLVAPLSDVVEAYETLVLDVLNLVVVHAPQSDVDGARERIHWTGTRPVS